MVFACGSLLVGGNGNLNEKSAGLLQREINTLKDQLQSMESSHATLEAANKQFRIKARGLQEKSDEDKLRYASLLVSKTEIEESLREEFKKTVDTDMEQFTLLEEDRKGANVKLNKAIQKLQEEMTRSEFLQSEKIALEEGFQRKQMEYDSFMREKNGIEARLELALDTITSLQSERTAMQESLHVARRQLETVVAESVRSELSESRDGENFEERIEQLLALIRQRNVELGESRSMYAKLQKELLNANLQLYSLQGEQKDIQSVRDEAATESLFFRKGRFDFLNFGGQFLQYTYNMAMGTRNDEQTSEPELVKFEDLFTQVSEQYKKSHDSSVEWLDSITIESNDDLDTTTSSGWLHSSRLFVKAHCESFITFAKMLLALLCIDFAVSSMITRWSSTKANKKKILQKIDYDNAPSGSLLRKTSYGCSIGNSKSWRSNY
jgi:hypothetical protein